MGEGEIEERKMGGIQDVNVYSYGGGAEGAVAWSEKKPIGYIWRILF